MVKAVVLMGYLFYLDPLNKKTPPNGNGFENLDSNHCLDQHLQPFCSISLVWKRVNIYDIYEYWFHFETLWKLMSTEYWFPCIFQHQHLPCHLRLDIRKIFQFLVLQEWYKDGQKRVFQRCAENKSRNQKDKTLVKAFRPIYMIYVTSAFLFLFVSSYACFLCMFPCNSYVLNSYIY